MVRNRLHEWNLFRDARGRFCTMLDAVRMAVPKKVKERRELWKGGRWVPLAMVRHHG